MEVLTLSNTVAYYEAEGITAVKSFTRQKQGIYRMANRIRNETLRKVFRSKLSINCQSRVDFIKLFCHKFTRIFYKLDLLITMCKMCHFSMEQSSLQKE
jgi:hypothetical protein